MAKLILKFDLNEEREEALAAQRGSYYKRALDEIDNHLRAKLKYEELADEEYHLYEKLREFVREQISEAESLS